MFQKKQTPNQSCFAQIQPIQPIQPSWMLQVIRCGSFSSSLCNIFSRGCVFLFLMVQMMYGMSEDTAESGSLVTLSDSVEGPEADAVSFEELERTSIDQLLPEGYEMTESLRNAPMPMLKQSRLGQILTRYYTESIGGASNLDKLNSIRMNAIYTTLDQEFEFEVISKKPNKLKVTTSNQEGKVILAYNGAQAWEKRLNANTPQVIHDEHQLRRLVKDARFFSHLLYPFQKGKAYEYLGVLRESDRICHRIRVHTEEQFILDFFIDVETFLEVKLLQIDKLGHFETTELYYSDYQLIEDIPFARRIETIIDGEWDSRYSVESIQLNIGLFNWMFDPSE